MAEGKVRIVLSLGAKTRAGFTVSLVLAATQTLQRGRPARPSKKTSCVRRRAGCFLKIKGSRKAELERSTTVVSYTYGENGFSQQLVRG